MMILALEFSSEQRSVAVARAGRVLAEAVTAGGRATDALGMIGKVLAEAGVRREEIEAIAVGLGPGSYTGIRTAIAVAQGWQLAREVKLLGGSSVEALVEQARAAGIAGRVNVAIDAQRGEFYLAAYEISADGWRESEPLRIVPATEVHSLLAAGERVIGTEGAEMFPTAAGLGMLAIRSPESVSAAGLAPVYLREVNFTKAALPSVTGGG